MSYNKLRKLYRDNDITFKSVKERRRWRRSDDVRNKEKDVRMLNELKNKVVEANTQEAMICFIDEAIFS